jgi:hypothetical protein
MFSVELLQLYAAADAFSGGSQLIFSEFLSHSLYLQRYDT